MGTLWRRCATVPQLSGLRFGVVRAVGRGIAVLDGVHVEQGKGEVLGVSFPIFTMGNAIGSPTVKCFRFVCENLTSLRKVIWEKGHVAAKVSPIGYNGAQQIRPPKYSFPWTDPQIPLPASSLDQSDL